MKHLRVGTRGSELALAQTRSVCERIRAIDGAAEIQEVVIRTAGDDAAERRADADWPVGAFATAIEAAILAGDVEFAVHSYKDLPTSPTGGLVIAAVPEREAAGDVLVTHRAVELRDLPSGLRVGTASPRRAAQLRRIGNVEIVPIRGNVPTRLARVRGGELEAIVIAAAGLRRLGIVPPHCVELPIDEFPPAPGQGALAVQCRVGHPAVELLQRLDHGPSRKAVDAERAFLHGIDGGCHAAVAAFAWVHADRVTLHAQCFGDDGGGMVEATESASDSVALGARVAESLRRKLAADR